VLLSRGTCAVLVLAIAAFSLCVRARGTAWLLPMHVSPDEHVFAEQLDLMRRGAAAPELDPRYGYYPHLVPRVAWLATIASLTGDAGGRIDGARFPSVRSVTDGDDATFLATDVMRGRDAWGMLVRTAWRIDALGATVEVYRVPR
jgi:hypothetical protein